MYLFLLGFVAGLITGISPCVVPMVPVLVAISLQKPSFRWLVWVIVGLAVSFAAVVLFADTLLSLFHLPSDLLRDAALIALGAVGLGLLIPKFGDQMERPFRHLVPTSFPTSAPAFVMGLALGPLYVPCAGPVLAAISVVGATNRVGGGAIELAIFFAFGAATPLLVLALISSRLSFSRRSVTHYASRIRRVSGGVLLVMAIAIGANLAGPLQTLIPSYTTYLQRHLESTSSATSALTAVTHEGSVLNQGTAPALAGISGWINTKNGRPITLSSLRGKVVLIDFWTYSCINCERAIPHIEAWYQRYAADGLVVIGVHTPEFGFEKVVANVRAAVHQFGITYPVAIDNGYTTWNAYHNDYWPADYLIDPGGKIVDTQFGEGNYGALEAAIRGLLVERGVTQLPPPTSVPDHTPTLPTTPETYLGTRYPSLGTRYVGTAIDSGTAATYHASPVLPDDDFTLNGTWTAQPEYLQAGASASLELMASARDIYLVLGGSGTIKVSYEGKTLMQSVSGMPRLYTLVQNSGSGYHRLTLSTSPGISLYDFTFG